MIVYSWLLFGPPCKFDQTRLATWTSNDNSWLSAC